MSRSASAMSVPRPRGWKASASLMRRRPCFVPRRGGTNRSTRSVNRSRPARSPFSNALKTSSAAISAATSAFPCGDNPAPCDALRSTAMSAVSSRSSTNTLTNGSPMRAVTFQSMARISSPGWYGRTSLNAMPRPLKTEWYPPASVSSTARRVVISMRRIFRISSAGAAMRRSGDFDPLQDALDDLLRGEVLRLGFVGE